MKGTELEIAYQMSVTVGFHTFFLSNIFLYLKINKNIKKKQLPVSCFKIHIFQLVKIFFIL